MNKYYLRKALELERFYRRELYQPAIDDYRDAKENGFPIRVYEGVAKYDVTYNRDCMISLLLDNYTYTGGAHGNTVRTSETWNLRTNSKIKLNEFFRSSNDYEDYILDHVMEEIKKDPSIYFDETEKLVADSFQPQNFYYTPKGLVVYFQQYEIAPYSSGIREFLIPYTVWVSPAF